MVRNGRQGVDARIKAVPDIMVRVISNGKDSVSSSATMRLQQISRRSWPKRWSAMDDNTREVLKQQISDLWDHDDPDNPPNSFVMASRITRSLKLMHQNLSEEEFEKFFRDFLGVMRDHWKENDE